MQENFLIGIGGTGSRVLEAFVHCCAAGFGPKGRVHLLLIDPDAGNGNLTRTKTLIQQYIKLREQFQRAEDNPTFQTELVIPPGDAPFVWSIFDKADQSLAKYIGYDNLKSSLTDQALADVADLLFTDLELKTPLNEGFRGHPSIGAVVMAAPPMGEYPFKMLKDNIPSEAGSARVFLVGSIFGGTGAAGFPTLGARQVLKFNPELQTALGENKSKVLLGGALVLPYFNFKVDNAKGEKMFVTPQDFPVATKSALHYYNDKELAFDQYYFIGDSLAQDVGQFATGAAGQENRPHYVELVSALAAFDFFGQQVPADGAGKSYFIANRDTPRVSWEDLPVTRYGNDIGTRQQQFRKAVSEFTLFCYTYLTVGRRYLAMPYDEVRSNSWYKDSFAKTYDKADAYKNPSHGDNHEYLNLMSSYAQLFLKWVTDLDDRDHVQLINRDMVLNGDAPVQEADGRLRLNIKDPEKFRDAIGLLLRDHKQGRNYEDFFGWLNHQKNVIGGDSMSARDKYLNIFFHAARDFAAANEAR